MNLKAQGMIGEIIIFAVVIFLSIMMFLFLTESDVGEDSEFTGELESDLTTVSTTSLMTYILEQPIDEEINDEGKYEVTFREILQAYNSKRKTINGEEHVIIDGEEYTVEEVEQDIEAYLSYEYSEEAVDAGFNSETTTVNYENFGTEITISTKDREFEESKGVPHWDSGGWRQYTRMIPTSEETIEVEIWMR